jgi:hypothetical protein
MIFKSTVVINLAVCVYISFGTFNTLLQFGFAVGLIADWRSKT